jgi:hypothetical protein
MFHDLKACRIFFAVGSSEPGGVTLRRVKSQLFIMLCGYCLLLMVLSGFAAGFFLIARQHWQQTQEDYWFMPAIFAASLLLIGALAWILARGILNEAVTKAQFQLEEPAALITYLGFIKRRLRERPFIEIKANYGNGPYTGIALLRFPPSRVVLMLQATHDIKTEGEALRQAALAAADFCRILKVEQKITTRSKAGT